MAKSRKSKDISTFIIGVVIVILLNIIAKQFFFRLDLTEENRYSMNENTEKMLERLDDQVYIEVYLKGDFHPGFKRFQKTIRETLEEFRVYAGDNVQYTFTDPMDFTDNKARNQFHQNLAEKGIQPTNLFTKENGQKVEKLIFPGAIVRYGTKEIAVQLLKGQGGASADEQLNNSIENLEYALADGIKKATQKGFKRIAFIDGHGELSPMETRNLEVDLKDYYDIAGLRLQSVVAIDTNIDLIIIAKPDTLITEHDIFKIDQFIMQGGKAIFLIDPMRVNLDSIGENGTYAFPYELGLTDLLFNYGVRLNSDLIQDFYCGVIPMFVGYEGDQPQTKLMPWRFYSIINKFSNHPISKSLGAVRARFASTIDTVKAIGIKKTPLLFTSKNSRIFPAPVRLNFNDARLELDPAIFTKGPLPIGYVLEGDFQSVFKNKLEKSTKEKFNFKENGVNNKIVVFSDGDLVRNEVSPDGKKTLPLGYDRYTKMTFANKDLLLNSIDYLIDEDGLMQARVKEIQLRPLDKEVIKKDKVKWQIINLIVPIVIILLFALIWSFRRKRKYKQFI